MIDEVAVRRFENANEPTDIKPVDALEAARKYVLEADDDDRPEHIIVILGRMSKETDSGSATHFFQAGNYRYHAQIGLCFEMIQLLRENG